MGNPYLDRAIDALGIYVGIRSRDAYLEAVLDSKIGLDLTAEDAALMDRTIPGRLALLRHISAGGLYAPSILAILDYCEELDIHDELAEDICITPSAEAKSLSSPLPEIHPLNVLKATTTAGDDESQGLGKWAGEDYYTTNDCGLKGSTISTAAYCRTGAGGLSPCHHQRPDWHLN